MKGLVEKSFGLQLKVIRFLGFYPCLKHKKLYRIYAFAIYCFLTVPVPTLAAIDLLLDENVDLTKISDGAFIICQVGCFIFKLLPFIINTDEIRRSIYMLEFVAFSNYTKKQETIINECINTCKGNCLMFFSFCGITFISWLITPFFRDNTRFPIEIWLPFDATSTSKRFYLVYLFIGLGVGNGALTNGIIDPLVSGLLCHATGQLKLLKNNLQFLSEYAEEEVANIVQNNHFIGINAENRVKNAIMYDRIKLCINHHSDILDFLTNHENVYSVVIFIQFTVSVVVICVSCLQLSMIEPFTYTFFAMIMFLITMLMEIFLYCYYGTTLFEESNTLTDAIYMGNWYEYDIKSKNALIILMERSKIPVKLTAGKILDLSLVTFTTILRRAYSLLAVLKNY